MQIQVVKKKEILNSEICMFYKLYDRATWDEIKQFILYVSHFFAKLPTAHLVQTSCNRHPNNSNCVLVFTPSRLTGANNSWKAWITSHAVLTRKLQMDKRKNYWGLPTAEALHSLVWGIPGCYHSKHETVATMLIYCWSSWPSIKSTFGQRLNFKT